MQNSVFVGKFTKITFLYHFYTSLIHFYPKHETQLTILPHNSLFCDTLENTKHIWKSQNTFGNHKTHLEITKHIWNHKPHLEITKHIWNHKTHLESQNTFGITKHIWNHKTHLESQNTFRNHKTHLEIGNSES